MHTIARAPLSILPFIFIVVTDAIPDMKQHECTHKMLLMLLLFFRGLLMFFVSLGFYSVTNFLSFVSFAFLFSRYACVCLCLVVWPSSRANIATQRPARCLSFDEAIVKERTRATEEKNEKANSKCSSLARASFIDVCLPDTNKKRKMANGYHSCTHTLISIDLLHHMIYIPVRDLLISVG